MNDAMFSNLAVLYFTEHLGLDQLHVTVEHGQTDYHGQGSHCAEHRRTEGNTTRVKLEVLHDSLI